MDVQGHQDATSAAEPIVQPRKRSIPRRLGCGLMLTLWFIFLLTPCGLFYLAANGEIRFEHSYIPHSHAHPRLLISLISEKEDRGVRIETSAIVNRQGDDLTTCIETTVRFLLWEYSGGNQDVRFCDCYERSETDADWEFEATYSDACSSIE